MLTPELMIAGVMLIALMIYTLSAGADFGGGAWTLLASGPRAEDQRQLVDDAIGPVIISPARPSVRPRMAASSR